MIRMPKFRRNEDGFLILSYSDEANQVFKKNKEKSSEKISKPHEEVRKQAIEAVKKRKGDVNNDLDVQGEYLVQFGGYQGQSFRWMLENVLSYAGWFIDNMRKEKPGKSNLSQNKFAFKTYVESFREGREIITKKRRARERKEKDEELKAKEKGQVPTPSVPKSLPASATTGHLSTHRVAAKYSSSAVAAASKFKPTIPPQTRCRKSATSTSTSTSTITTATASRDDDQEILAITEKIEENLVRKPQQQPQPEPEELIESTQESTPDEVLQQAIPEPMSQCQETPQVKTASMAPSVSEIDPDHPPLPEGWRKTLPKADHLWVSQALFTTEKGKTVLDWKRVDKLWWDPPKPPLIPGRQPSPDQYFTQRLLLWMPRKLWKVTLYCPHSGCDKKPLNSAGIYKTVRQVLDIDCNYNLAAEYLECKSCKRKVISWSPGIVSQLDMGHQFLFPVLLTYQYACDVRVIRLLRERGLGNSSTQLQKKLTEEHSENYLQRSSYYFTECEHFEKQVKSLLTGPFTFQEPPAFVPVPKYKWLLTVYAQDVMSRIDYIKSSITSIFGRILKMDSTKKIVKKLAGSSAGTAAWATNIGNERGQVLMSVLTVNEGAGLENMANGLMRRYSMAGVAPPEVLYVDRDCCSGTTVKTKELFSLWDKLIIRLDIWHFMRRFAAGCTTESHPLYGVFLSRLSQCIFTWSDEDLELLKSAKKSQLQQEGIADPSDEAVVAKITRRELALHCRRKTRGIVQTATMIYDLLMTFSGPQGCDSAGVPLIDNQRIWQIWDTQQRHIECIQDPAGVQLYTQTGVLKKGDVILPTYRCARGSTSLESFHLHINRFVPGTLASDMHFQAYLLDGLLRWNADRATSAVAGGTTGPESYSGALKQAVNEQSMRVIGREIAPSVQNVGIYTGECIGVEYLYNQTGEVLRDNAIDEDAQQPGVEPLSDVDPDQIDEGFEDANDETVSRAEEVFIVPSGSDEGSDENNSDQDSAEDTSNELSCEADVSVGPDHIEGYRQVQDLADYLVSLREGNMALSNTQAKEIIKLWTNLHDYDKQPTTFAPRHRTQLTKGKFKAPKRRTTNVIPGLDSTRRCFLGANSGPAQWPDCNRYVEAVISRLCEQYPGPERSKGDSKARWTLVCKAYREIKERIVSNGKVMRETAIQMPEVNQTTVSQWFIKRQKKTEQETLKQGLRPPPHAASTSQELPAAVPLPQTLPQVTFPLPFTFAFPENTTGKATLKGTRQPVAIQPMPAKTVQPVAIQPRPVQVAIKPVPATIVHTAIGPVPIQPKAVDAQPETTISRKRNRNRTSKDQKSPYEKTCSYCGKPREPTTHRMYYGQWYCKNTMSEDFESWKSHQSSKRKKTE